LMMGHIWWPLNKPLLFFVFLLSSSCQCRS
jgi:hypothetical protein